MPQPSEKAIKAAKAIIDQIGKLQSEGFNLAYEMAAGDSWGPSSDDWKEGENHVLIGVAKIIENEMK